MALYDLYKAEIITAQIALQFASSPKDLKLRLQGMRVS
jgi:Tfp pilus assembly ATPase PilU